MSSTDAQFMEAILGAPDDEALRLDYADFLAPRKDPRAELIRVQVALARLAREQAARNYVPDEWQAMRELESSLLKAHGEQWAAPVKGLVTSWRLRRGFVEEMALDAADFLSRAEKIHSVAPVLYLRLTGVDKVALELFHSAHLDRIKALDLSDNALGDRGAELLASSSHLGALRWLSLDSTRIGQAGLEALAATSNLPALRYLSFARNSTPDPTARPGGTDAMDGSINDMHHPPEGEALEARHGKKAWLHFSAAHSAGFPPGMDAV